MEITRVKQYVYLTEAIVSMDKIIHMDELSTEEFIRFVKSFIDISKREVEISEKIDGQNFSFGIDTSGDFFSKTKKSAPVKDPSVYGEFSFLQGVKDYHAILKTNSNVLLMVKKQLQQLEQLPDLNFDMQIFGELLPSSQTNIVKYDADKIGNGAIVLFDVKVNGTSILKKPFAKQVFTALAKNLDNKGGWRVYEKPVVDSKNFQFMVHHLMTLESLYAKYFDIMKSRKKADSATKEKAKRVIQTVMDNIKKQFMDKMLRNRLSVLGGVNPEGFILRDFTNNMLVKLVDKDSFSAENTEGSKYAREAGIAVKNTNMSIKNDVFGNADIMKNFAKVIEKAVDWAFVRKQADPSFKVQSLDDILKVAYDDMMDEKRIKYTSDQAIDKTNSYLNDLVGKLKKMQTDLEKERETLPASKFQISKEKLDAFIKSAESTINDLNALKGNDGIKVYLTIMAFVFGPHKIQDLKAQFNLQEVRDVTLFTITEDFADVVPQKGKWATVSKISKAKADPELKKNLFHLVDTTYRKVLGEPNWSIRSVNDVLGTKYNVWFAVDLDEHPDANATIFGQQRNGVKLAGIGHDGESISKKSLMQAVCGILKKKGHWIEASGAMASSIKKDSAVPVVKDTNVLKKLFPDSEFVETFDDGSYIRTLGGGNKTEREYVFGNPTV